MPEFRRPDDFQQQGRVERFRPKSERRHEVGTAHARNGRAKQGHDEDLQPRLIQSSREFVRHFVPPDYLVDGLLQRRFIYSLTAATGAGKTAVALLLSALVALGRSIGDRGVKLGRVLYLAGENPDDIRMRWLAMADNQGFKAEEIDVHFIPGSFSIPALMQRVREEADLLGGFDFVVIDTSAAYFEGDDENGNVQMGNHGRILRGLTTLPRGPCVLVLCHPTKNAINDNLLPRGGGAFVAEMDGNLVCRKKDYIIDLHWHGKFRGPDFDPVSFQLLTVTSEALKDSEGRRIPTVIAKPTTETVRSELQAEARRDEDAMLVLLLKAPGGSLASMAQALGWQYGKDNNPHKMRASRTLENLRRDKLATQKRGVWTLTADGKKEAKNAIKTC